MSLFYPWWLHGLWGLWVVWTLPHIDSQYYSYNMILALMFKNILFSVIWDNCSETLAQRLSWKTRFPLLLHLESDYSFLKTSSKTLWKSQFQFLFKCENILNSLEYIVPLYFELQLYFLLNFDLKSFEQS